MLERLGENTPAMSNCNIDILFFPLLGLYVDNLKVALPSKPCFSN